MRKFQTGQRLRDALVYICCLIKFPRMGLSWRSQIFGNPDIAMIGMETRLGKGFFFSIVKTFSPFSRFVIVNFFPLSPFPTGLRLGLLGFTANGRLKFKVPPKIWEPRAFLAVARVCVLFWEENGIPYSVTTDYKFLFNSDDHFLQNQYLYLHFNLEICIISYVLQLDCELPLISKSELGAR